MFGPSRFFSPGTMASADFSQFVVTTHFFFRIRLLNAPERPPRVRTKSFASSTCRIYVHRFRVAIGLQPLWRPHPRCPPDAISVRQVKGLLTASFRFHLTMDTLAVQLCASRHRVRSGLSPVRLRPCQAHHNEKLPPVGRQFCYVGKNYTRAAVMMAIL